MGKRDFFTHLGRFWAAKISFALSGILFWIVAARCYPVEEIGVASVVISSASLMLFLSCLGMGPVLIRFLPRSPNRITLLTMHLTVSLLLLCFFLSVFFFFFGRFSPWAAIGQDFWRGMFFTASIISFFFFQVIEMLLMAFKKTEKLLWADVLQYFSRLVFLPLMTGWGGCGIFFSNGLSALLGLMLGFSFFLKELPGLFSRWSWDPQVFRETLPFSIVNFFGGASFFLSGVLMPSILFRFFSSREAGLFYLPWMIYSVYVSLLGSVTGTLFMKASHGEEESASLRRAVFLIVFLVTAGILFFVPAAPHILALFSKDFETGSVTILRVFFISLVFFSIRQIYGTLCNIHKRIAQNGWITFVFVGMLILFAVPAVSKRGAEGFAWAWLAANGVAALFVLALAFTQREWLKALYLNLNTTHHDLGPKGR